mmetsp:Transcript_13233/g.33025  ORF Transcript_13233/g.33025 Transcript_13233/m.33025 type:complete len:361 (+) Transcript_13233:2-1084(+)
MNGVALDLEVDVEWAVLLGNPSNWHGLSVGAAHVTVWDSELKENPLAHVRIPRPKMRHRHRVILSHQKLVSDDQNIADVATIASNLLLQMTAKENYTMYVTLKATDWHFEGLLGTWSLDIEEIGCVAPMWFSEGLKILGVGKDDGVSLGYYWKLAIQQGFAWYWDTQDFPLDIQDMKASGSLWHLFRGIAAVYVALVAGLIAQGMVAFYAWISSLIAVEELEDELTPGARRPVPANSPYGPGAVELAVMRSRHSHVDGAWPGSHTGWTDGQDWPRPGTPPHGWADGQTWHRPGTPPHGWAADQANPRRASAPQRWDACRADDMPVWDHEGGASLPAQSHCQLWGGETDWTQAGAGWGHDG